MFLVYDKVLFEYLSPRLNVNTQVQQTQATDDLAQVKRLVTSVMIGSLAVRHRLTFIKDHVLKDILENLVLHGNAMQKKCMEFEELLQHFPKGQRFESTDKLSIFCLLRRLCLVHRYLICVHVVLKF